MIINGIDTKDISVVVQGAIDLANTSLCLNQLRKSFPEAEIILSTWKDSPVSELAYDVLIENQDPGGIRCRHAVDNTNRQIVSTRNGVMRASRKFILKIRSDCFMKSAKLLEYWNMYPERNSQFKWFDHRVIIPSLYSKRFLDINSRIPTPFHFSDWLQFGEANDIKKIWDIEEVDSRIFADYYSEKKYRGNKLQRRWLNCQYVAESYIYSSSAKKSFPEIKYEGLHDYCSENIIMSEQLLFSNFIIIEAKNLDMIINKAPYKDIILDVDKFRKKQKGCYYTEKEFSQEYKKGIKS